MNKQAHNYIFEYHDAITSGRIRAGKWIKAIYKILVEGIKNGEWVFDQKKANKAIKFIENYCHHSEGRNDLLKLELWQKAIVSAIFGILDKNTGYRQFREVFLVVARKNGKTLFAAAIMAYMAYIDGEYGAKTVLSGPEIGAGRSCIRRILPDRAAGRRTFRDQQETPFGYLRSGVQHDHKEDRVQL